MIGGYNRFMPLIISSPFLLILISKYFNFKPFLFCFVLSFLVIIMALYFGYISYLNIRKDLSDN